MAEGDRKPSLISYQKGRAIKLSAPKKITWWIALVLAVFGLIGAIVSVPVLSVAPVWLVLVSAALLLVARSVQGLLREAARMS